MKEARAKATTRRFVSAATLALISALSMLLLSEQSRAETYPERPIKIVVPFPAGGPTDVAARLVAQALSSRLSQNVIVENLAGGGGKLGTKAVATASPDGYTLLLGGTNVNAIPASLKNLGYDPIGSFAPIAAICADTMVLAVSPRVSANTVEELVRQAKSQPGEFKFGAPQGIYTHLAGEFFKVKTGTDLLFVPYKGAAPAITDVLGGHIEMVFNNKSVLLTHIKEGKLKALAVTAEKRWPELPATPTMQEAGIAGFPTEVSFGLLAPAGTPAAIIDILNHAVNEGLRSGEVRASLEKLGVEPRFGSPRDFALVLAEQAKEWKAVIEATGIKLE
jgi:tripartite-type tricarboxylate transporter receptor subunit TctC